MRNETINNYIKLKLFLWETDWWHLISSYVAAESIAEYYPYLWIPKSQLCPQCPSWLFRVLKCDVFIFASYVGSNTHQEVVVWWVLTVCCKELRRIPRSQLKARFLELFVVLLLLFCILIYQFITLLQFNYSTSNSILLSISVIVVVIFSNNKYFPLFSNQNILSQHYLFEFLFSSKHFLHSTVFNLLIIQLKIIQLSMNRNCKLWDNQSSSSFFFSS